MVLDAVTLRTTPLGVTDICDHRSVFGDLPGCTDTLLTLSNPKKHVRMPAQSKESAGCCMCSWEWIRRRSWGVIGSLYCCWLPFPLLMPFRSDFSGQLLWSGLSKPSSMCNILMILRYCCTVVKARVRPRYAAYLQMVWEQAGTGDTLIALQNSRYRRRCDLYVALVDSAKVKDLQLATSVSNW